MERTHPSHSATLCQVCGVDLAAITAKPYCHRKRVCQKHLQADDVIIPGQVGPHRFCFQCGRFHPLTCFDGKRRSCRERLVQRRKTMSTDDLYGDGTPNDNNGGSSSSSSSNHTVQHAMQAPQGESTPCTSAAALGSRTAEPERQGDVWSTAAAAADSGGGESWAPWMPPLAQQQGLTQCRQTPAELVDCWAAFAGTEAACSMAPEQQQQQQYMRASWSNGSQQPASSMDLQGCDSKYQQLLEVLLQQELSPTSSNSNSLAEPLPQVSDAALESLLLPAGSCCCLSQQAAAAMPANTQAPLRSPWMLCEPTIPGAALQHEFGTEGGADSHTCVTGCSYPAVGTALCSSPMSSSSLLPAVPPAAGIVNHQPTSMMEASQVAVQLVADADAYPDQTALRREQLLLLQADMLREELLLRQASINSTPAAAAVATAGGVRPCAQPYLEVVCSSMGGQVTQTAAGPDAASSAPQVNTGGVTPRLGTSLTETPACGQTALVPSSILLGPDAAWAACCDCPGFCSSHHQQGTEAAAQKDTAAAGRQSFPAQFDLLEAQACTAAAQLYDLQQWVEGVLNDCPATAVI